MPVGPAVISVRTIGPNDKQLRYVNSRYVFVNPGCAYAMSVDGNPIIVAAGNGYMTLAHDDKVDVVDEIIHVFLVRGISVNQIAMCMQFASESCEQLFVDRAWAAGLRYLWAMNTLTDRMKKCQARGGNLILVRRLRIF